MSKFTLALLHLTILYTIALLRKNHYFAPNMLQIKNDLLSLQHKNKI